MNNKYIMALALGTVALVSPNIAAAADAKTLGEMATSAEANIYAIKQLSLSLFYLAGLVLFGGGLFLLYKDQKTPNQGHAKNGFISIAIGVCLLLIPSLLGVFSTSIGGDKAEVTKNLTGSKGF